MRMQLLKSAIVLAALALLVLMPVVEANYMIGYPYVGTAPKQHEARRWVFSGFYEDRDLAADSLFRDRSVNRYYIGASQGRVWKSSLFYSPNRELNYAYDETTLVASGRRCLGCELGLYDLVTPLNRRGKYYYAWSRLGTTRKFVYTGLAGTTDSKLTSYDYSGRRGSARVMPLRTGVQQSRLLYSEEQLAALREEAETQLASDYVMRSGKRCLNCEYEPGMFRGRYYATSPEEARDFQYVPLS